MDEYELANMNVLHLNHGDAPLPAFFPDGTYGAVRCVDTADLLDCNVPGIVMNCYHLLTKPGLGVLRHFGGVRRFTGWGGPVLTDSGGFQVFSLIHENPKFGEIRKNEIIFRHENGSKLSLTPEKCIQAQFACDSDIMMCLDYCSHPDDSYETTAEAVEITIHWAERCKREYEKQLQHWIDKRKRDCENECSSNYKREHKLGRERENPLATHNTAQDTRPLLFAIIQGGGYRDLRERCAEALLSIGFDGYGFGGWPLTTDMQLIEDILEYTANLMPDDAVKYAMGVGKPENVIKCAAMGYNLFDCVIPTRDARHNRLYVLENDRQHTAYNTYYVLDKEHIRDGRPVSEACGCHTCRNYSRAYLYHLAKAGDSSASRLATIHNLRFYSDLMERIRRQNGNVPWRDA